MSNNNNGQNPPPSYSPPPARYGAPSAPSQYPGYAQPVQPAQTPAESQNEIYYGQGQQPYGAAGSYPNQQPYAYPTAPVAAPTNAMAVVSLVTAIFGLFPIAVITGHIAINKIKYSGEQGRTLAIIGLIFGYIGVAVFGIMILTWMAILFTVMATM